MNFRSIISICDKSENPHTPQPYNNTGNTSWSNNSSAKSIGTLSFLILDNKA